MNLDKLIFDVKERMSAMSDDRRIDKRYVTHLIGVARADYLRQLLSKRPGHNTLNLEQDHEITITTPNRSIFTGLTLAGTVMRSTSVIPKVINPNAMASYYKIRTADVLKNTIELVDYERAMNLTFEFDAVYAFMDSDQHMYFLMKNNHQELKYAIVTSIFEDPIAADATLTDYPISPDSWTYILPKVIEALAGRPMEDPINNSEADYVEAKDDRRK
jgi:hypothetical protein